MSATLRGVRREQSAFRQEAEATQRTMRARMEMRVNVANAAKAVAGITVAAGAAALAVGGLAVSFNDDLQKSLNGVQSATGVADEMMGQMKTTMVSIYNHNFGENFAEIGGAMSIINQQTGLAGDALKKTTENALALKDTFGLEVTDSIRGANQLMKQFGMDAEQSYNLIAQGAQWGLNANGDLVDTLNEYSGTFAAQGFSAENMFNMLSNGASSGVRDVDLLADAIKEFGIRSKDGSKASAAGFEALGFNAATMTKAFGAGGSTSKAAFDKTTKALLAMKDPVAQNIAGTALMGTQWEDLGLKGVAALVSTQGEINNSVDALAKINEVKYNTFGEAMSGIKRNLQTGLLIPLGEQLMPKMNEFAGMVNANMPKIKNEISFAFNTAGMAISSVGMAVQETKEFFQDHWTVVAPILAGIAAGASAFYIITGAMKVWRGITLLATAAQGLFNLTLAANPIGLAVIAIGALVAAGVALYMNWDIVKSKASSLWITIENAFKTGVNGAIGLINNLIDKINLIPGVNIPLVARVSLNTIENNTSDGMRSARGIDGSLAKGLNYVPFDGYLAQLHKGERVQTASQNPYNGGSSGGVVVHMNGTVIREESDIHKIANAIMLKLDAAAANM